MSHYSDPTLYRQLSQPHASNAEANAALESFYDKVRAAREAAGLANVYIIVADSFVTADGTEGQFISESMCGDPLMAETMVAYAFGVEQKIRQDRVAQLLANTIKDHRR